MRIALIAGAHPYSGIGKYAFNLFERLYNQRRDIDMLYCDTEGTPEFNHDRIKVLRQSFRWPFKGKTLLPMYYYFPGKIPRGYDIYHISSARLSRVTKFRKPAIITHYDLATLLFPQMYSFPQRLWTRILLRYYKEADKVIAISEASRDELLGLDIVPRGKMAVVRPGYDEKLYKPLCKQEARQKLRLPQEAKIVLNVGSEEARKDVPTLIKAVYGLQPEIAELMLIRVGSTTPANDALKRRITVREYQDIPEFQMPLFYNSADLFVFPSIYEGDLGYPPLEAMACGIPTVVTSAVKTCKDGCATIPAQDVGALTVTMREILTSPERHKQLSISALNEAKKFTLSREVDEIYKVYEEVFNEKRVSGGS